MPIPIEMTQCTVFPWGTQLPEKPVVKWGIDPTSDHLHLGHLLPLRLIRSLCAQGAEFHLVLGVFTAQIGDPSGQNTMRPLLQKEEIRNNAHALLEQVKSFLNGYHIIYHYNSEWLSTGETVNILVQLAQHFSVRRLLSRDTFTEREKSNVAPVHTHELLLPLFQALDSYELGNNVEIGGSDQLFNFHITRDTLKYLGKDPGMFIMTPILNGTDGKKMSKSLGNTISFQDSPQDMFGKIMSVSDEVMTQWEPLFCTSQDRHHRGGDILHPLVRKKMLASRIVTDIHGEEAAQVAEKFFTQTVQEQHMPLNEEEYIPIPWMIDFMAWVARLMNISKNKARTLITQGAVDVNGEQVRSPHHKIKIGDRVKVGKHTYGIVSLE